jgi:hypothetical protein
VFNRVDNSGATISDKNDRLRSVKACRALTEKHGLYIAGGKENVNRQQLRDPDSVKYAIYDAVKAALPECKSWNDLEKRLSRDGIAVTFKYSGGTDIRQGVIFGKDGFSFNGSKIDRAFSFSKLDTALNGNAQRLESQTSPTREVLNVSVPLPERATVPSLTPSPQPDRGHLSEPQHSHGRSGGNIFSGLDFDPGPQRDDPDNDPRKKLRRKRKRGQGYSIG